MTHIELNMIQTAGVGALSLLAGMVMTRRIAFLQQFCVPSPVSGGLVFSLLTLLLSSCIGCVLYSDSCHRGHPRKN